MEQTNISNIGTTELKALAYDQMIQIELAQNNLRVINQELSRRTQQQVGPPVVESPPIEPLPVGSIQKI